MYIREQSGTSKEIMTGRTYSRLTLSHGPKGRQPCHGQLQSTSSSISEAPVGQARDMLPFLSDPRKAPRIWDEQGSPKNYVYDIDVNVGEGDWRNIPWRLKSGNFTGNVDVGVLRAPCQYAPAESLH